MTELEQKILDIIQDGFPIVERPYGVIAETLGETEKTVFDCVESLRSAGIIRRIGGVYDTKRLGLVSRLCAGKVPSVATGAVDDSALEQFATAVMGISAITHNYVRSHEYNVWFTVIAESEAALQSIIERLCRETSLHDVHSMPAKRMFKINTVMGKSAHRQTPVAHSLSEPLPVLSDSDKARIRLLSGDLPHSLTPFADLGIDLGDALYDFSSKRMRRFGAVLRHQNAGYPCNAMVCFDVGENAAEAGTKLAAQPFVSHCYERPAFEGFPFNVYGMFHAQNEDELASYVNVAAMALGNPKYKVLHSLRELKKTSYRYFAD